MKATLIFLAALSLAVPAFAKDKEIKLEEAPAGVQARVKKITDAGSTLEKVEIEDKDKNANTYGIRITDKNGVRWEIIVDAAGNVLKMDPKKTKDSNEPKKPDAPKEPKKAKK